MKEERPKLPVEQRAKQQTPAEMVQALMANIRGQFYGDQGAHAWHRDSHYLKREVVLWPASWLNERGLTMSPADYERLFLEKIQDMKQNCAVVKFNYFPSYLRSCIKDHFEHNEDAIYETAKAARVASTVAALGALPAPNVVPPLVAARDVLLAGKKRTKAAPQVATAKQGELL